MPAHTKSAVSPGGDHLGTGMFNTTFHIEHSTGGPQQELLSSPYLSQAPSVPFSLSLQKIHYPHN